MQNSKKWRHDDSDKRGKKGVEMQQKMPTCYCNKLTHVKLHAGFKIAKRGSPIKD